MSKYLTVLAAAMLVLSVTVAVACGDDDDDGSSGDGAIQVGALLPLTGALASYGEASEAALDEAVSAINEAGGPGVDLVVEDTNSDPPTALAKLEDLHDQGIRIVIGPYSSSEVAAVLDFASDNGILLLSPLSTAHSLAIADDNLFRFTPDDIEEGVAVAHLAWEDGIRTVIIVNRDDVGNGGLAIAMRQAFAAVGGTVVEGLVYPANESDFVDEVESLEATLAGISAPPEEVGVYLAAFAEVESLFSAVVESESLSALRWYGSNSVALSGELIANPTASDFAVTAGYPNPILGLRDADEALWGPVSERVNGHIGRDPDAFALAAYDALVTAHAAAVNAGDSADDSKLRAEVAAVANTSSGLT
ncbi:MAG: penicillin-binding protein activator, partial [Tepidiformaceae bacterium]